MILKNLMKRQVSLWLFMFCLGCVAVPFSHAQSLTGRKPKQLQPPSQQKLQQAQPQPEQSYWIPRCEASVEGVLPKCEIFQRLLVKDTGQRVAELAIGFPDGVGKNARGVAVLPLGILLNEKTSLRIDDGALFNFQVRYCTQNGCYAFLDITPQIIAEMKRGGEASFYFITIEGKEMQIDLSLVGFTKALEVLGAL